MQKKPPIIEGKRVDKQYDLDNESHVLELGLNPKADLKIADKYVHYQHCKHAVIELKSSSTIHKGIEQIETTIERLLKVKRPVDYAILVVKKINTYERRFYRMGKDNILLNPTTKEPHRIRVGAYSWVIRIFYEDQVNSMYHNMRKYLSEVD